MEALNRKVEELKRSSLTKAKNGVVIAFSGGVDSATLAAISLQVLGEKAVAVIAQSPTYTATSLQDAQKIAQEIGIKLYVTLTNELQNTRFHQKPRKPLLLLQKRTAAKPALQRNMVSQRFLRAQTLAI